MNEPPHAGSAAAPAEDAAAATSADQVRRIGWLHFVNDLSLEFVTPLLPSVVGAAWVGLMEGAADGVAQALKLVTGRASDRHGIRAPWVRSGYLVNAIARPLCGLGMLLALPLVIVLCRILDRVGKGVRGSATDALVADWVPGQGRARAFARMRTMDHLGATLGALAAAAAAFLLSAQQLWMPMVGLVVATLWVVQLTRGLRDPVRHPAPAPGPASAAGPAPALGWWPSGSALRRPLLAIGVATLATRVSPLLILLQVAGAFGGDQQRWPLWLTCLGWAALGLIQAAASALAGGMTERMGPASMLRLVWGAGMAVFLALALLPGPWLLLAGIGFGVVVGVGEGVEKTWIAERCERTERARAFGALGLVTAATGLAGNALIGLLLGHHRLATCLGMVLVTLLGMLLSLGRPPPVQPTAG